MCARWRALREPTGNLVPQSANGPRIFVGVGQTSGKIGAVSYTVTARLFTSPKSGAVGSTSTISGYGFRSYQTVSVFWQNPTTFLGQAMADVNGTFTGSSAIQFTVPASAPSGVNKIFGKGDKQGPHGKGTFIVE